MIELGKPYREVFVIAALAYPHIIAEPKVALFPTQWIELWIDRTCFYNHSLLLSAPLDKVETVVVALVMYLYLLWRSIHEFP